MQSSPNWMAAVWFYLLYIVGILFFVVYPALRKGSWKYALTTGLFFGLITYMTYDLTNLAVLKGWPVLLTVVDTLWGAALGGVTSVLSTLVIRRLG